MDILPAQPPGPNRQTPNVNLQYVVIALVAVVALIAAYLVMKSGGSSTPPAAVTPATVSPSAAPSSGARIDSLVVSSADLGSGWLEKVIPGGDQVAGQVSLDLCGGGYASEAMRTARLQVALKHGPTVLSNEVVEYAPGGSQEAYRELRHHLSNCPKTPVAMPEQGAPRVRFRLVPLHKHRPWVAMTVAVRATETAGGRSFTGIGVYQFVGKWMSAVYSQDVSLASRAAVLRAAAIAAKKLSNQADGGPST